MNGKIVLNYDGKHIMVRGCENFKITTAPNMRYYNSDVPLIKLFEKMFNKIEKDRAAGITIG